MSVLQRLRILRHRLKGSLGESDAATLRETQAALAGLVACQASEARAAAAARWADERYREAASQVQRADVEIRHWRGRAMVAEEARRELWRAVEAAGLGCQDLEIAVADAEERAAAAARAAERHGTPAPVTVAQVAAIETEAAEGRARVFHLSCLLSIAERERDRLIAERDALAVAPGRAAPAALTEARSC